LAKLGEHIENSQVAELMRRSSHEAEVDKQHVSFIIQSRHAGRGRQIVLITRKAPGKL
jgi:hypothetical protein